MTDKEYFNDIAAALTAVTDGRAKYMSKNPNAKYIDADGKERPIAWALDIARMHIKSLKQAAEKSD